MSNEKHPDAQQLYSRSEACRILNIGLTKYSELIGSGELRSLRIGRSRKVPSSEIERFIRAKLEETD